jgi:hypothetical protein
MASYAESKILNETIFNLFSEPGMEKRAIDAINDYTRWRMRELGFTRKILPPLVITNDDLDRVPDTDKPVKVVDMEPDSPAAISVPLNTLPENWYLEGPRYRVLFDRILTPRITKDIDELRTWVMDIRQVVHDNMIKDMLAEEDGKFIKTVDRVLHLPDTNHPFSGVKQWVRSPFSAGGLSRKNLVESFKILPQTFSRLEVMTVLVNHITIRDIQKWHRDEMGGDFSEALIRDGWVSGVSFMNANWVVTIKRELVPNGTLYFFGDPKFIGKFYILEDATLCVERNFYQLTFFAYEYLGMAIAHPGGLARADFGWSGNTPPSF